MYLLRVVAIYATVTLTHAQSVLFPHGYFDSNKISAVDAFYLNMLAVSTLENNGITIQDLNDLAASRIAPEVEQAGSLKEKVHEVELEKERIKIEENNGPLIVKERPLTKDNRPPAPFKSRVRREDADDDDFNPFEEIATRAPSTVAPQLQRILNRNQILGISGARPRHKIGVPHEGEMSEQGWIHPRRRRPYINVDVSKSQVVELPLPPELIE